MWDGVCLVTFFFWSWVWSVKVPLEMYQRNERKEKVQKGQRERQTYRARGRLESIAQVTPTEDEVGLQDKEWVSIGQQMDTGLRDAFGTGNGTTWQGSDLQGRVLDRGWTYRTRSRISKYD